MSDWYSQEPDTLESIMGELAATDRPPPQPAPPTSALMLPRDSGVAEAQSYMQPVAAGYNFRDRSAPDAWKKYDDEQLQKQIAPHSYLPYGVATQQEAEHAYRSTGESLRDWYLPTTTWGAGLTGATAAAAKSLPGPAKLAGLAAGFALSPSDADASFLKAPPGKLLTRAEKLLSEGMDVQGIWDRTGLFQGADGIWRYEIPDKGSRWLVDPAKLVGEKNLKLGDVFEHKALFPHAPWLPETKLTVTREHPDIGGGFLRADPAAGRPHNQMEVNVDYAHDTPHGVVMHEGTHVTQFEQDLNSGTNINTHPLSAEAQDIYNKMLGRFLTRPSEAELVAQGVVGPHYSYKQFMKEYNNAMSDLPRLDRELRDKAAMQSYARSAGENEADVVQRRANRDQEYLINVPPPADYQVPIEKQIVTFNKGQLPLPNLAVEPWQMATKKPTGFAPGSIAEQNAAGFADPKLRAKAEGLRGTYPQYAEKYPETGPPELMWKILDNKKLGLGIGPPTPEQYASGKFLKKAGGTVPYDTLEEALAKAKEPGFFLEKKLTPEAEKFQKDRNIIQQDMDLHGYQKYFDPAKRFDVDPKKYGPFEDTVATASPKTAKTRDEWEKTYGTDEIRARLQSGFKEGQGVPASDRWYLMGQLEQAYIKELGPKAGREAFANEFARMMAATTGGAAPYDNFLMSHYANVVNKQGERLPDAGWKLPFPIGGRFASGNMKQAQKFIDEGIGNWPMKNPKRYDFSSAFMGNKNAGTIDEQMMTTFDPTLKAKQPVWYGPATKTLREEAGKAGVDTRGFQDVGWAGLKKQKTEAAGDKFEYEGPMIDQINRSIETTHRLTGMSIKEIVRRGLILKEIPMYGLGGLITGGAVSKMGGVADQGEYKQ